MRQELADAAAEAERHVLSRQLSLVPSQTTPKFEAHDARTRALIAEYRRLEQYRHGASLLRRMEDWRLIDAFQGAREKQEYLEPLIAAARSDLIAHQDKLIFLIVALEPIRRGVSGGFVRAHGGVGRTDAVDWRDRTQARTLREIERQRRGRQSSTPSSATPFRPPSDGSPGSGRSPPSMRVSSYARI